MKNGGTLPSRDVILFLSDNTEAVSLWEAIFAQQGCLLLWKTRPRTMLDLLAWFSPALVILDLLTLPEEQVHLCRLTRRSFYGPILVLLQENDPQQVMDLQEAGADECLIQPEGSVYLPVKALTWMRRYQRMDPDASRLHGMM